MNPKLLQKQFERLAQRDPLQASFPKPAASSEPWETEAFYQSGHEDIARLASVMESLGLKLSGERVVDFGCGAGRHTFALAQHFKEAVGIDIAPTLVDYANSRNPHKTRCRIYANLSHELAEIEDESVCVVYANQTLQHLPPRSIRKYFKTFQRILAPGGLLVFQLPSQLNFDLPANRKLMAMPFRRIARLCKLALNYAPLFKPKPYVEKRHFRSHKLIRHLENRRGFHLVSAFETSAPDSVWRDFSYIFRKRDEDRRFWAELG